MTYSARGTVYDRAVSDPHWYYFPSLAVNWMNPMVLGFCGSSATNYVGAYYTARFAGGTMLGKPVEIEPGGIYNNFDPTYHGNRWGDYSYTCLDPVDNQTVWTI